MSCNDSMLSHSFEFEICNALNTSGIIVNGELEPDEDDVNENDQNIDVDALDDSVVVLSDVEEENHDVFAIDESTLIHIDDDNDEEIQLIAIRPKSKSRLLGPRPPSENNNNGEIAVTSIGNNSIDPETKEAYVKEYVENGQGLLYSEEHGLIIFHLNHTYRNGRKLRSGDENTLSCGSYVKFIDIKYEDDNYSGENVDDFDYRTVSSSGFLRQAAAVWIGNRPEHIWRTIKNEEHTKEMADHRKRFVALAKDKSNKFVACDLVRAMGTITGYMDDNFGLLETSDGYDRGKMLMVLFHVNDVYLFKRRLDKHDQVPVSDQCPPGLRVSFDARALKGKFKGVCYQAAAVFAGTWPKTPHPTMLPGGPGSYCPKYELSVNLKNNSFYYLNLAFRRESDKNLERFKQIAERQGTKLRPERYEINNYHDYSNWRHRVAPTYYQNKRRFGGKFEKKTYAEFKRPLKNSRLKKSWIKGIKQEMAYHPPIKMEPVFIKQERN